MAAEIVSVEEETLDARIEEQRQIRAALAEYFSILQEWSSNNRAADEIEQQV